LQHLGKLIEEFFGDNPFSLSPLPAPGGVGNDGTLLQSLVFILSVELGQRIYHDLFQQALDGRLVFRRVILKDARKNSGQIGR
jgi:hypothetical protein